MNESVSSARAGLELGCTYVCFDAGSEKDPAASQNKKTKMKKSKE
jgi:hypothetical protein